MLASILDILLEKPFKSKSIKAKYAILAGLYQQAFLNTPNHAAVNETVKAVGELGFDTLKGLTNAVMHGYLRKKAEIDERLNKSYETKSLNDIAEYLFKLTSLYNKFYQDNRVLAEEDNDLKISWLALTELVYKVNSLLLDTLGIIVPDKM